MEDFQSEPRSREQIEKEIAALQEIIDNGTGQGGAYGVNEDVANAEKDIKALQAELKNLDEGIA